MIYKRNIKDIVKDIIDSIDKTIYITNVVRAGDVHTVTVHDLKWLQSPYTILINNNEYQITAIDYDKDELTLTGTETITVNTFTAPVIKYFYGMIRETNTELMKEPEQTNKIPMVYLYEEFTETFNDNPVDTIERESFLRMFFLSQADYKNFLRTDFFENCEIPMRRLQEHFIQACKNYTLIDTLTTYDVTTKTKFGVFVNDSGVEVPYWVDNLSGVECKITLKLYKSMQCEGTPTLYHYTLPPQQT